MRPKIRYLYSSLESLYSCRFCRQSVALHTVYGPPRPQLSFLPTHIRTPVIRLISTETQEWLKNEVKTGLKYSFLITTTGFLLIVMAAGIQEEYRARRYPTPDEWNWNTRLQFRAAKAREESDDPWLKNWMAIGASYKTVLDKLHDPQRDGQRIQKQSDPTAHKEISVLGGFKAGEIPGFDISQNSEPWRRSYYEVLMGLVRVAEQLNNYVTDKTTIQNISWPANTVYSPSNPRPWPVSVGMPPSPAEENCAAAFESPEIFYKMVLTTRGFTQKQRLDAAISYGLWLDYTGSTERAEKVYKWCLAIANTNSATSEQAIIDPSTGIIKNKASSLPSENILAATTALAIHYATNSKVELALPIFISVLRARRSLPTTPSTMLSTLRHMEEGESRSTVQNVFATMRKFLEPPKYPPPPSDGSTPPYKDAKERCEEAVLMLYIGEILYVSKNSQSTREDGLAWTREAVDNAEAELRQKGVCADAKKICGQCLEMGLQNWIAMVDSLAQEERAKRPTLSPSWLNFGHQESALGRWESEKEVIQDRIIRANSLLTES